ncbi:MAG: helix-turn-helix domain-containing protein [Ruminococcaceae bacterium]|nr:helix-turn-helix domain-containing protein [Oscillospiraceae bacterium]
MKHKLNDSKYIAEFLANNFEKEEIIPEIFEFFKIDCMERCSFDPSQLDEKIMKFNDKTECDVALLEDIISFIITGRDNVKKRENELYNRIMDTVVETMTSDIKFEEIAKQLHISYYYMCHLVKDKSGMTLNTFRNRKRLEKAMRMLAEGNEKISDIATLSGYNNISYFTETFTKYIGITPTVFKEQAQNICFHPFYEYDDMLLAIKFESAEFLDKEIKTVTQDIQSVCVCSPDDNFKFLHETAIIEYHGVLYASWYHCRERELYGYTPICGKRSFDEGKTWSELEIICEDKSEKILYCPPVYGICDDKLYMIVNQMVAPDHIHSLDLYMLNTKTDKFELLWSKPIPFKLNTNVVTLPNGKLMLPGRIAELDGFPTTPAVLISDSGKIDSEWRLIKIAENGNLPDGTTLVHPEISVICVGETLYMFNRNDLRRVPIVYISKDCGETWSNAHSHDIPYVSSKIYCGELSDGRHYMLCNTDKFNRSKLTAYFTDGESLRFTKRLDILETSGKAWGEIHYPAAWEYGDYLYVIATKLHAGIGRGAELFKINLKK